MRESVSERKNLLKCACVLQTEIGFDFSIRSICSPFYRSNDRCKMNEGDAPET